MKSYKDLTRHFGKSLSGEVFQAFLLSMFSDLTEYNIVESDYIISEKTGIELGFTNKTAIYDYNDYVVLEKGIPLFSHFILYPKSIATVNELPFESHFTDKRTEIFEKAGNPTQTKKGYTELLDKHFLIDNYKMDDIIVSFDYHVEDQTINFIQIRDNNLVEHLKL